MPLLLTIKDPDLYVDPEFPHNNRSIGRDLERDLCWIPARRLNEHALANEWHIFDGIEPADLLQGSGNTCWLTAALAVLAEFPSAVRALFVRNGHREVRGVPKDGRYVVKLFDHRANDFRDITVDEYVPYDPHECLTPFCRPHGNELWVLIVEKAMAKMFGSYSELLGSNSAVAFRALTGEKDTVLWKRTSPVVETKVEEQPPPIQKGKSSARANQKKVEKVPDPVFIWTERKLKVRDLCFNEPDAGQHTKEGELFFELLRSYYGRNYLMCAAIDGVVDKERPDGLVEGHAYSILNIAEIESHKLLKMRNPWGGEKEWSGAWSDNDGAWNSNPKVKSCLRPTFGPDGVFWMCWSDFAKCFDSVYICYKSMHGRAGAQSVDGAPSNRMTQAEKLTIAEKEVRRLFQQADANQIGSLDVKELVVIMEELGMDGKDAEKLLKAADKNGNGLIEAQEFLDWIFSSKGKAAKKAVHIATEMGVAQQMLESGES